MGDMIEIYNILTGKYDSIVISNFYIKGKCFNNERAQTIFFKKDAD